MNKRTILAVLLAAVMAFALCASALAADDTETITVRFEGGKVSISVTPTDWDITGVMPNSQYFTPSDHFTITNGGDWSVTTTIGGEVATGDLGASWALSPTGSPSTNTYALLYTSNGVDYYPIPPTAVYFMPLACSQSQSFGLKALTPQNSDCLQPGEVITTTITISAYKS